MNSSEVTPYDYQANSSKNFIDPVKKLWKCKKEDDSGNGDVDFVQVTTASAEGGNFKLTNQKADGGGGIIQVSGKQKNGQNNVSFGQISKIFESWRRFQLHNFIQKYFHK